MHNQPHRAGSLPGGRELVAIAEATDACKVRRHEGLTALNYAYVTGEPDQFEWPRSEMRGLIVDEANGEVVARPFQKFWGFNEEGARGTDWSERHVVLPKLDGSLVYPAKSRWVTRGGVTDTSRRAEALAAGIGAPLDRLLEALRSDPRDGAACTPCFEYIGPDNQIVIRYDDPRLVLLAVRRIVDGAYWSNERMRRAFDASVGAGRHRNLGVVAPLADAGTTGSADYVRELTTRVQGWGGESEGLVVAFEPSGHRIKIKSLDYVALHRARDDYSTESRVLTVWSNGDAQKLLANLSPDRAARLGRYYAELEWAIGTSATRIAGEAAQHWLAHEGVRKDAAIAWTRATADRLAVRAAGFTVFKALAAGTDAGEAARTHIRNAIGRACRHAASIDAKVKPLLTTTAPVWAPPDGNERDSEQ